MHIRRIYLIKTVSERDRDRHKERGRDTEFMPIEIEYTIA